MIYTIYNDKNEQIGFTYDLEEARDICYGQDFYIVKEFTCKGCHDVGAQERFDYYGITTGHYCDSCYENNYPYRKDRYATIEFDGHGERLDDNY